MKACMRVRVLEAQDGEDGMPVASRVEIEDVSFVSDDHEQGIDADGCLHVTGSWGVR